MRKASAGATGVASGGYAMGSEAGNTGRRWQPVIRSVLLLLVAVHCSPRTTPTGGGGGGFGGDSIPIAGHMLHVPVGFTVNIFAQGVSGVPLLAVCRGDAVDATPSGSRQVVRLGGANGVGTAQSVVPVLTGLSGP